MKHPIVLWGATGQAIVLNEFLNSAGYTLAALYDRNRDLSSFTKDVPMYHDESEFFHFLKEKNGWKFAVAIGGDGGRDRLLIDEKLKKAGLEAATLLHPNSHIATDAEIGQGSQILINATVCSRAVIGRQVIVNSSASVDHECELSDGVHVGPGAVLAGCVKVGESTFIGTGAVILPNVRIGNHCMIGAGSVVSKDIPDGVVAVGAPCRVIRKHSNSGN